MVGIRMHVEKVSAGTPNGARNALDDIEIAPLAQIRDGLDHDALRKDDGERGRRRFFPVHGRADVGPEKLALPADKPCLQV